MARRLASAPAWLALACLGLAIMPTTPVAHASAASSTPAMAPQAPQAPGQRTAPKPSPPALHFVAQYVTHVTTRDPVVFITVDDGSFRDPAFLARVRRQHLPVTVFLTNAASGGAHATYFRALQSAGAVIEDHTLKHPDLTRLTAAERRTEICGAADKDRRSFQRRPALLRPPYGHWDSAVMATARECGLHAVVGWDVVMPQSGGLQTWDGRQRLHAGDIVILHFLPGLDGQVERLLGIIRAQHLRVGLLENYV